MFLQDGCIENGIFLIGKRIQVATHTLQTVQYLECRASLGSFEGDMFTEVSYTLLAFSLLARTSIDANATIDYG
jgi:hypothetical protein